MILTVLQALLTADTSASARAAVISARVLLIIGMKASSDYGCLFWHKKKALLF